MINWEIERANQNYCGYCIDFTCICNGTCFKADNHLNLDYKKNRKVHIENEILKHKKRLADLIFSQHEWDGFHDVVFEATKVSLNQEGLENLFWQLPKNLIDLTFYHGLTDSVVRDDIYVYLQSIDIEIK